MSSNQKTITTNGLEVLVVEVPDNTYATEIFEGKLIAKRGFEFYQQWDDYKLPEGNWKGKLFQEMSDFECMEIVGKDLFYTIKSWKDIHIRNLSSLLRSHGFNPDTQKLFIAVKEK